MNEWKLYAAYLCLLMMTSTKSFSLVCEWMEWTRKLHKEHLWHVSNIQLLVFILSPVSTIQYTVFLAWWSKIQFLTSCIQRLVLLLNLLCCKQKYHWIQDQVSARIKWKISGRKSLLPLTKICVCSMCGTLRSWAGIFWRIKDTGCFFSLGLPRKS